MALWSLPEIGQSQTQNEASGRLWCLIEAAGSDHQPQQVLPMQVQPWQAA